MLSKRAIQATFLSVIYAYVFAKPGGIAEQKTGGNVGEDSRRSLNQQQITIISVGNTSIVTQADDVASPKPAFSARTLTIFNEQNFQNVFFTIDKPGQTIVFEEIITNTGNHYNSATGVFVAPVAGQYFFTTSVTDLSNQGGTVLHIVVNGKRVAEVSTVQGQIGGGGSTSVALEMRPGDEVFVRSYNAGGKVVGSFTGFQI